MDLYAQSASALNEKRLTASLLEQTRVLSLLYDIGKELTSILDRDSLLRKVGERVKLLIDYDLFCVMILNPETRQLERALALKYNEKAEGHGTLALGEGLCGTAAMERRPVRVSEVAKDPRYVRCDLGAGVQSELVVPLIAQDRVLGVLDLESLRPDAFTEEHEQMLATLASTVAIALENAGLYSQLQQAELHRKADLERAREVQDLLLPKAIPQLQGVDLAALYHPAQEVGGDFYDFLVYGDGSLAIAVGDVAGKGPAAALLASLGVGILREHAMHQPSMPAEMLADLNGHLQLPGGNGRFIAMAFGVYDPQTRELSLANAGFPQPILLSKGRASVLEISGTPLGLLPASAYDSLRLNLEPGDTVVFCSDGVLERVNQSEEEYGIDRLVSKLTSLGDSASAHQVAAEVLQSVDQHAGANPRPDRGDDRTIVVLRIHPSGTGNIGDAPMFSL